LHWGRRCSARRNGKKSEGSTSLGVIRIPSRGATLHELNLFAGEKVAETEEAG
jgi:hypothetical protein